MRFPMQQRRVIGGFLLLSLVAGIAVFLIISASPPEDESDTAEVDMPPQFNSVVEAVPEAVSDKVIIAAIPEKPVQTIPAAAQKPQMADMKTPQKPVANASLTSAAGKKKAVVTTKNTPAPKVTQTVWIIQLASFSVAENARQFQQRISQLGYKTRITPVVSAGKTVYRVRLFPIKQRQRAEKLVQTLNQKLGIQAQIITSNQ